MFTNSLLVLVRAYCIFYLALVTDFFTPYRPDPLSQGLSLADHAHYRRFTTQYRRKKSMVKNLWISVGIITLLNPVLQFAMCLGLFTACLSFAILDETQ